MTWFDAARRLIRMAQHRCWVCGKSLGAMVKEHNGFAYCSIECACYDGTFSVRKGWVRLPHIFLGRCMSRKFHHEHQE